MEDNSQSAKDQIKKTIEAKSTLNAPFAASEARATPDKASKWPVYDSGPSEYDRTFDGLLGQDNTVQGLVDEIRTANGNVTMADLMGTGLVRNLNNVNNGLSVSLARPSELGIPNEDFVEGDLFKRDTWSNVDNWLSSKGEPDFDLIVSRPLGGGPQNTSELPAYMLIVRNAYRRLNPDHGVMLLQISHNPNIQRQVGIWATGLVDQGFDIKANEHAIAIHKNRTSPHNLPG